MNALKNWMVAMDFTNHDQHLIEYTHQLAQAFVPEEIIFNHITPRIEMPKRFLKEPPPSKEDLLEVLQEKVYSVFKDRYAVKCEIHEGTPYFDLWRESHIRHTDLLIIGEKNKQEARKIVPENFVRKSFCSVLFVPEKTKNIKSVWVPIDFSENSREALVFADQIRSTYHQAKITCHYVFETPSISLVAKDMQEEYTMFFKEESERKMEEFVKPLDLKDIEFHCTPWVYVKPSDHIKEEAENQGADIIVMNSGGKNRISSFLLGSNTMEMIQLEKNIPVLILKNKIDHVRAWDVLTNL
jgi:nucleotide-binding universal stress UspA family protein